MTDEFQPPAPSPPRKPRHRRLRRFLRWCLILGLTGLVGLVLLAFFLNTVGLPEMVKRPVIREFRERGWHLEFSRLLLGWDHGVIVENLFLHRTNAFTGPQLYAPRAQVRFDPDSLQLLQVKVRSVQVEEARIFYPVSITNQPTRTLQLENVGLDLILHSDGQWEFTSVQADLFNVRVQLSGILTNGSALQTWRLPKQTKLSAQRQEWLHRLLTHAEQFHHSEGTSLVASFQGDALDINSFNGSILVTLPIVSSPWLTATNLSFKATVPHGARNPLPSRLRIDADTALTPWAGASRVQFIAEASLRIDDPLPDHIRVQGSVARLESPTASFQADSASLQAVFSPGQSLDSPTNLQLSIQFTNADTRLAHIAEVTLNALAQPNPTNTSWMDTQLEITARNVSGQWGSTSSSHLLARATLPPLDQLKPFVANPSSLPDFPWPAEAAITFNAIDTQGIQATQLVTTAQWKSPTLTLQHTSQLFEGRLAFQIDLNTLTRLLSFTANSSIDAQQIAPLLTDSGRNWLQRYSWKTPPKVTASGHLIVPAWTHRRPDWRREILPDVALAGAFEVLGGAYRGVPFNSAISPFNLTNMTWRLPDLVVQRDEGALHATYASDQVTRDFHWNLDSTIDVRIAKPLLQKESAREKFDYVEYSIPPRIQGQIWGRWKDSSRLGADLRVTATNFSYRGQSATEAEAHVLYTNKILTLLHPVIRRDALFGSAPLVVADFTSRMVALSNAFGNLPPGDVAAAIGPRTAKIIAPYHFDAPPHITVNGIIDTQRGRLQSDLHFDIKGGPFRWWHTRFDSISGRLHWLNRDLFMTHLVGAFPDGEVTANAHFYFPTNPGAHFDFHATTTNTGLRSLIRHVFAKTNQLDGTFAGELVITNGFSRDTNSWQGFGQFELSDGLIWDIPVFGIFSPILNTILPGFGNSRARQATASFVVSNSVFHTRDLEIDASAMRIRYDGSVGIDHTIDGTMEIEFLRNFPAFGPLISKLFWPVTKLFEFKVGGTLLNPNSEPTHLIPKVLLLPLHPLRITPPRRPPPVKASE